MPRRRPLRGWNQRQVSAMESMIPGTIGGRVSSAAPVLSVSDVLAEQAGDVGVSELVTGEGYQVDEFDLASDGAQELPPLTYLPIAPHEHLFLNVAHQQKDVDWTRDGQVVSLLAAMDPRAGDHVTIEYAYSFGVPVAIGEASDFGDVSFADSFPALVDTIDVTIPAGAEAGDVLVLWAAQASGFAGSASTLTGPAGWTAHDGSLAGVGGNYQTAALLMTKIASAGDAGSTVTVTASAASGYMAVGIIAYTGGAVQAAETNESASGALSWTAPTAAAAPGRTCVCLFAATRSGTIIGLPAGPTERFAVGDGVSIAGGEQAAAGSTAPTVTVTVPSGADPAPSWCAATVVLG